MFEPGQRLATVRTALIWGAAPFAFFAIEPLIDPRLNMSSFVVGIIVMAIFVITALTAAYQLVFRGGGEDNGAAERKFEYLLIASISLFTLTVAGVWTGNQVNNHLFQKFAERSAPLWAAIAEYHRKNGKPPASFTELTPDYIDQIPEPGLGAGSRYVLVTPKPGAGVMRGHPWMLTVSIDRIDPEGETLVIFPSRLFANFGTIDAGRFRGYIDDWGKVEFGRWCRPDNTKFNCVHQQE